MDQISQRVILAMIADVVVTGGRPDWLGEAAHTELVAALDIADGRTRLTKIVAILETHVTDKVSRRFVDARPELAA